MYSLSIKVPIYFIDSHSLQRKDFPNFDKDLVNALIERLKTLEKSLFNYPTKPSAKAFETSYGFDPKRVMIEVFYRNGFCYVNLISDIPGDTIIKVNAFGYIQTNYKSFDCFITNYLMSLLGAFSATITHNDAKYIAFLDYKHYVTIC